MREQTHSLHDWQQGPEKLKNEYLNKSYLSLHQSKKNERVSFFYWRQLHILLGQKHKFQTSCLDERTLSY